MDRMDNHTPDQSYLADDDDPIEGSNQDEVADTASISSSLTHLQTMPV